ncbi:MAG: NADH-quinone oxidoreductase subunit N [Acidimicrobiales bacterium]
MMSPVLAQLEFTRPAIDWHAVAPELVLLAVGAILTLVDIIWLEKGRKVTSSLAGFGLLLPLIPIVTLAIDDDEARTLFNGAYVVDRYSLVLKALFLLSAYLVVLLSTNYIAEGDYWENEYYGLLVASVLGMVVMASSRDLISIFVALELLSIPAYMLATWRKRDLKSNEAGLKYYLMGVFASAIMLYGMSLVFGVAGSTLLTDINEAVSESSSSEAVVTLGIIFVVVGFAFKVSAFPFHTWSPDTYEGSPTPVAAFLAVASKAAGFVALMNLIVVGFLGRDDVFQPLIWLLAAASMTAGNVMALRQTNIVRLMAYSGVAQAGFILAPLAVAGESAEAADQAVSAMVTYLVIYAAMNLGAFAVIISVARKTRTGELESYNGLFQYAPTLAVVMTVFLASLAGIPPLGGWFAKFQVFNSLVTPGTAWGYTLAVIAAVNAVIALGYYLKLAGRMWIEEPYLGDRAPVRVPVALVSALAITAISTIAFGVVPGVVTHFTEVSLL